jgi:preprotein translocase subunit SecA
MAAGHPWRAALRQRYRRVAGVPIDADLRSYQRLLTRIDDAGADRLSDARLRERFDDIRREAAAGRPLDALLPGAFAVIREACARTLGMRPFDVQMMAGMALHEGKLAQLATGEGKTLVAVMPAALNALCGRGVHVLTANDYLAGRDASWMGPAYDVLGLRAAAVTARLDRAARQAAYAADITYVTAKEAGFDFLRDHTVVDPAELVQRPFQYAIVDEADFILIDEARVPLVIGAASSDPPIPHQRIAAAVRRLTPGTDFRVGEHERNVTLTDAGFRHAQTLLGCGPLHDPAQYLLLAAIHVALHAEVLLARDRDYIVRGGRVEFVDEFTGRVADNRRWPHGIQPAATWTYLLNDNPFASFWVSLAAPGNVGVSVATAFLAVAYWPVSLVVAAGTFFRRARARRSL